jgi:uncharacterized protein YcfL
VSSSALFFYVFYCTASSFLSSFIVYFVPFSYVQISTLLAKIKTKIKQIDRATFSGSQTVKKASYWRFYWYNRRGQKMLTEKKAIERDTLEIMYSDMMLHGIRKVYNKQGVRSVCRMRGMRDNHSM